MEGESNITAKPSPEEVRRFLENGHVLATYRDVEKLGNLAGISQDNINLLKIAALYHEIALPEGRDGHEQRSAATAEEDLKKFGFPQRDTETVKDIILGTGGHIEDEVYVTEPTENLLVLIMRDVDMANSGKKNYLEIIEDLRREWNVGDKKAWIETQIVFLSKLKFHTKEASDLWGNQKNLNIQALKEQLKIF